jgi:hypothetical protein
LDQRLVAWQGVGIALVMMALTAMVRASARNVPAPV